ncbi:addiction module protein [Scytonema sp. PCC 10023]|uniref:addiction module protein n=1 Tax=Scytonema sp. PCC 10023 TaxID=1680591 RepID=UPI0039C5CB65
MTETAEKLKLELSQLSAQERAEIAHFLIQSLDEDVDNENFENDVEAAWNKELTKRLEDIHRGTGIGEPSNQVFSELRDKYS